MSPQLTEAFARLPAYLGGHVAVSVTALLLGLTISLPLALIATRRPALRNVLLAVASVVQTIPSLALLALFYPLLLGLAVLCERLFGAGFLEQDVATVAGQHYTLSFYVAGDPDASMAEIASTMPRSPTRFITKAFLAAAAAEGLYCQNPISR